MSRQRRRRCSGTRAALGVCPGSRGERGERAGERERQAQRRPTRRACRHAAGGRSEHAARSPRIVRRSHHDYPDGLLARMALPEGFTLFALIFDPASSEAHLQGLLAELHWEEQRFTIYGRTMPMPRLVAMYGPVGYRYSGVAHPPRPLSPPLEVIRTRVENGTGRPFNSVLANLYRDGRDSVGWLRASEYDHGGQQAIASVRFG